MELLDDPKPAAKQPAKAVLTIRLIKAAFEQLEKECFEVTELELIDEDSEMLYQIDEEKDVDGEDLKKEEISANSESTDDVQEVINNNGGIMSF
jgi:hypothetical protein